MADIRPLTDTHAHLGHIARRLGTEAVESALAAYSAAGESVPPGERPFIVDIGVEPGDLAGRRARFAAWDCVRFAAGLWPGREALDDPEAAMDALIADIDSGHAVALGECGLDYHHMEASREAQIDLFTRQARLAARRGLPLIVHSRDAFEDTLLVAQSIAGSVPVVIHCFSYGPEEAKAFLDAGCFLSFAGNLSFSKAVPLRQAIALVDRDRLLLETDAPYMNPMPERGRPSTPLDILRTLSAAAAARSEDPDSLRQALQRNAFRIFAG